MNYEEGTLIFSRLVWSPFSDRSGAIDLDELEAAMKHLGLELTRHDLDKIIDEVYFIILERTPNTYDS